MGCLSAKQKLNRRPGRQAQKADPDYDELWLIRTYQANRQSPEGREAADRILAHHRGLIVMWCERMTSHLDGMDIDDAIQEAHLGFLDAIRYWKPGKGAKLASYAKCAVLNRLAKWRRTRRNMPLPQE